MQTLIDSFNRVHDYLRISLTDKCNLNCIYCNPSDYKINKLQRNQILSFDELLRLINIFAGKLGIKKIRFTGGEPLVRKDVLSFFQSVFSLKQKYGFETGITTNGTLLEDKLESLKKYSIDKLNISIDSLNPGKYKFITGKDNLIEVLRSIKKANELIFNPLKLNVVVIKNINDDEILDFVDFIIDSDMNVRFIEYMPFGNNRWNKNEFISFDEIKNIIEDKYQLNEILSIKNLVAKDFSINGHSGTVSFISSISNHFCETCNRLRIDAQGKMKLCLFSSGENELNFKELLNDSNYNDDKISELIQKALLPKPQVHPDISELIKLEENNMLNIGG
jgi:molybdenum cofactor biosynthesis protein A